ncbi:hypothetical protein V6N11_058919 [Hibiscus sabdariffa]|uniref:Uncharacterized protein n=1 Tax=Hibiscus sabdariffa TaxID=183260 RepID=A0ABR2U5U8_9ROSI
MVDDSSENTDNSKEGRDVPRDAPTVSSAARVIQGQGDMGNTVESPRQLDGMRDISAAEADGEGGVLQCLRQSWTLR